MNRLFLGAVVVALCFAPMTSRAEDTSAPREDATATQAPAQDANAPAESDATEYAEREKAAPADLEQFAGGDRGVYIGTGALLVALIVVLLLTL